MSTRYIDRSRVLAHLRCPRERYLSYHHAGTGITSSQFRIPLESGTNIHAGLERLLKGESIEASVDSAVGAYQADAEDAMSAQGIHVDSFDYTIAEQTALVEALIRVYALRGLPALLAEYKIVEVESEYEYDLTPGQVMMSRLDGLLARLDNGNEVVLSFKTDSGGGLERKIADARLDLQGLSEPLARMMRGASLPSGVKMEYLIKGSWKEDERGSGLRFQDSPLVRPWMRELPVRGREYAWKYFWDCPGIEHKTLGANGREWACKGNIGTRHGLGDSWQRVPIWEHMPIKEWIGMLDSATIQPGAGDALAESLYLPPVISRKEVDVYRALRVIRTQEQKIDDALSLLGEHTDDLGHPMIEALDVLFPATGAYSGQCLNSFGGVCQFATLCHAAGPEEALAKWSELGFQRRTPHHAGELVAMQNA